MDALVPFTTSGQLIDCVDKKMLVALRDGRKIIGVLRTFDQFANLVLNDSVERIHVDNEYADIPRGLFLIRGENVVLMGEVDLDVEDNVPLREGQLEEVMEKSALVDENRAIMDSIRDAALRDRGFCTERIEGDVDVHSYGHEPTSFSIERKQQQTQAQAQQEAFLLQQQQQKFQQQQSLEQQQQQSFLQQTQMYPSPQPPLQPPQSDIQQLPPLHAPQATSPFPQHMMFNSPHLRPN